MKIARNAQKNHNKHVKTSFWGLIQELSSLTADDTLVVAAVRNIFGTQSVRMGPSLAPVRLPTGAMRIKRKLVNKQRSQEANSRSD